MTVVGWCVLWAVTHDRSHGHPVQLRGGGSSCAAAGKVVALLDRIAKLEAAAPKLVQVGWFTPGMADGPNVGSLIDGRHGADDEPVFRVVPAVAAGPDEPGRCPVMDVERWRCSLPDGHDEPFHVYSHVEDGGAAAPAEVAP